MRPFLPEDAATLPMIKIKLDHSRQTKKTDTTMTNKVVPMKNTTLGKSLAPVGQKGTDDASVFRKRLTKAPNKQVSPFKAYVK